MAERLPEEKGQASEELIVANLGLAGTVAKRYLWSGMDYQDLFQAACVGLCYAAKRFEPSRGTPFAAYATYWMRNELIETTHNWKSIVRVPRLSSRRKAHLLQGVCGRDYEIATKPTAGLGLQALDRLSYRDPYYQIDNADEVEEAIKNIHPAAQQFIRVRYGIGCEQIANTDEAATACGLGERLGRAYHKYAMEQMAKIRKTA